MTKKSDGFQNNLMGDKHNVMGDKLNVMGDDIRYTKIKVKTLSLIIEYWIEEDRNNEGRKVPLLI